MKDVFESVMGFLVFAYVVWISVLLVITAYKLICLYIKNGKENK